MWSVLAAIALLLIAGALRLIGIGWGWIVTFLLVLILAGMSTGVGMVLCHMISI